MPPRKRELAADIANATGVDAGAVSDVLTELANQAYAAASSGFVLPGFGKFRVVPGASSTGVNPFTGRATVFSAPKEIEFTVDTEAMKCFLAGAAKPTLATLNTPGTSKLQSVGLTPNPDDLEAAGIQPDTSYRFTVGGEPDWLQAAEVPVCCGQTMLFYGQLDSLNNREYSIGDMGMLYVFYCRSCSSSRSIMQF
ncbi:MAG: HU family DNA-binding protein [Thermoguttaceae bacterium]